MQNEITLFVYLISSPFYPAHSLSEVKSLLQNWRASCE